MIFDGPALGIDVIAIDVLVLLVVSSIISVNVVHALFHAAAAAAGR